MTQYILADNFSRKFNYEIDMRISICLAKLISSAKFIIWFGQVDYANYLFHFASIIVTLIYNS